MFRDLPNSIINPDVVGVGSVVGHGHDYDSQCENYLIISNRDKNAVALIDNQTFALASQWVPVEDINYLSSGECRALLVEAANKLNWTFTDFFFSTRGMKTTMFKNTGSR
jgi:hypothetical protein